MNMTKKNMRKIMILIVFAATMLWLVFNYTVLINLGKFVFKLLTPVIAGISIAFILNVPMKQIENKVFKVLKRKHKKIIRVLSLLTSIILIFGIVGLIMFLVIPEFIEALISITQNMPKSYDWINKIINKANEFYPELSDYFKNIDIKLIIDHLVGSSNNIATVIIGFLSGLISKLVTLFIGFILSIYILLGKESIIREGKKVLNAFFSRHVVREVINIVKLANTTFSSFLTGQCLDACLAGFLVFLFLTIFKLPYALIIGVLFAVTALIPYIGAFITLVVGSILIGVTNPIGALTYVIIFFIVQQIDDNFTYPRIVGKSVGLPPLLALVAVLCGGTIFGFIGMIISIPLASILYSLFKEYVNNKLKEKGM